MPEETAPAVTSAETPKTVAPVATIATLGKFEGQSVVLKGWLYNSRESGKLLFPIFRDGTGTVQGVAHVKSVPPEVFEALKGLTQESSVIVTGKVRADKRAPGGFELDVEDIEVIQRVPESDPYPITLKEHGVDFLMEHGISGCGRPGNRPFCAFARRSCVRLPNILTTTDSSGPIRRS